MSFVSRVFGKRSRVPERTAPPVDAAPDIASLSAQAKEHFRLGRMDQARLCFHRVLEIDPKHAQTLYVLGGIALKDGQTGAAIDLVRRAIDADPSNADFHFSLGTVLASIGQPKDAIPCFQDAVRLRPEFPEWRRHLAAAMHAAGEPFEVVRAPTDTLEAGSTGAQALLDLGETFHNLGRLEEAEAAFREAVQQAPQTAGPHISLATVLLALGRPVEAESAARHAVQIGPEMPMAWFILGTALSDQARHVEAVEHLQKAIDLDPHLEMSWDKLLFSMIYSDRWSAREIFEAHARWGKRFAPAPLRRIDPAHRQPGHRLRIAYLSPDYRQHPVAFFMEAPLRHHDRSRFEVFCYHTDGRVDPTTRRLQGLADHWRWMVTPSDEAIEQVIRDDGIDILVELSGHTVGHKLGMLARRVAPIQITYLGYPHSTGLAAIDYRITDARADPPEQADTLHTERVLRLPESFLCYTPPEPTPAVSVLPLIRNGFVTFGSFNNFAKLSPSVLALWAEILVSVPNARLMIKTWGFKDQALRRFLSNQLERAGADPARIDIVNPTAGHQEHLEAYSDMDIALDTFPYHGTTTTLDSLWMGVPVITLAGDRHVSRVGLSVLACLGLTELIAHSPEEYVAIAVRLAGDVARLEQLRKTLRTTLAGSPLTDGKSFSRRLEQVYLQVWASALIDSSDGN